MKLSFLMPAYALILTSAADFSDPSYNTSSTPLGPNQHTDETPRARVDDAVTSTRPVCVKTVTIDEKYDGIVIPNGCPKPEIIIRTSTSSISPPQSSHLSSPTTSFNIHVSTSRTTTFPRLLATINARWSDTLLPSQSNIESPSVIPRTQAASSSQPDSTLTESPSPPWFPTMTITRSTTSTHTVTVTPVAAVAPRLPGQIVLVGNHTRSRSFLHTHHSGISANKNHTSSNTTGTARLKTSPGTSNTTDIANTHAAKLASTLTSATQGAINASTGPLPRTTFTTSTDIISSLPLATAIVSSANKSESARNMVGRAPAMLSVEVVVGFVGFVGVVGGVRWLVGV